MLTLIADATYPHLYRIQYPNGWISSPANLSRAKDAAYDHARYLLVGQKPFRGPSDGRKAGCLMWGEVEVSGRDTKPGVSSTELR